MGDDVPHIVDCPLGCGESIDTHANFEGVPGHLRRDCPVAEEMRCDGPERSDPDPAEAPR